MQKKDEEQPIREVIDEMIRLMGGEDKMQEASLKADWEKVAGKMIAQYTTGIRLRKNVLYIDLKSASVKNELLYLKDAIRIKVNQYLGKEVVEKVVF